MTQTFTIFRLVFGYGLRFGECGSVEQYDSRAQAVTSALNFAEQLGLRALIKHE